MKGAHGHGCKWLISAPLTQDTLLAVDEGLKAQGIPVQHYLLDSWCVPASASPLTLHWRAIGRIRPLGCLHRSSFDLGLAFAGGMGKASTAESQSGRILHRASARTGPIASHEDFTPSKLRSTRPSGSTTVAHYQISVAVRIPVPNDGFTTHCCPVHIRFTHFREMGGLEPVQREVPVCREWTATGLSTVGRPLQEEPRGVAPHHDQTRCVRVSNSVRGCVCI